jgi:hypothetical protein
VSEGDEDDGDLVGAMAIVCSRGRPEMIVAMATKMRTLVRMDASLAIF